ncbi:MAG: 50S ribosomal protein L10, partial [Deltaproteobacteria bacterium]|nr:50S ribosomal protein L10 [Deltaproteobacteria bacterium]
MNREQKAQRVTELKERLDRTEFLVLTDFTGLDVTDITDLRARLKEAQGEYQVVKNTLIRLAVKDRPSEKLAEHLIGPNGLALAYQDVIQVAKALHEFAKEKKNKFTLKAGLLEGEVVGPEQIQALANLPSREVLLSQLLRVLSAAPTNL